MNEQQHTDERWHGACGAGIFHAMFRLIAVSGSLWAGESH